MPTRKHIRFYPEKEESHKEILAWLAEQRGSDNENLIWLMERGLSEPSSSDVDYEDLLPKIRGIVSSAVKSALRNANVTMSPEEQETVADEGVKDFIKNMAGNF